MILTIPPLYYLHWRQLETKASGDFNVGRSCSVRPSSSAFLEIHLKFVCQNLEAFVFFFQGIVNPITVGFVKFPPQPPAFCCQRLPGKHFWLRSAQTFCLSLTAFRHTKVGLDIVIEVHWKQSQIKGIQSEDIRFGDLESTVISFHQELLGMQPNECCEKSHSSRENTVFFSRTSDCGVEDVWHLLSPKEWHTLCALNVSHFISHQAGFGHICYFREDQRSGNKILMMWKWANNLVISLGGFHSKSIPIFDRAWPIFRGC